MTRWLQAARQATGAGTELTIPIKRNQEKVETAEKSIFECVLSVSSVLSEGGHVEPEPEPDLARASEETSDAGVLSVSSVLSEGGHVEPEPERAHGLTPDAAAYLAHLRLHGPQSYGAVARALGWGATQAWRTEDELRTLGLIVHSSRGMSAASWKSE